MCTSSIMYILYLPACGAKRTCSIRLRISSTELLEAASNSKILKEALSLKEEQEPQVSQGSKLSLRFSQLITFANIRAQVVFPTPLGPQNKNDWASLSFLIAFLRVVVILFCPTTSSNLAGRYLRADTMKDIFFVRCAKCDYDVLINKWLKSLLSY